MAPRRATARGGNSTPATRRRAPAGVRKNTRTRQAPSRYGQQRDPDHSTPRTEHTNSPSSNSEEPEPSTPQYSQASPNNEPINISHSQPSNTISPQPATPISSRDVDSHTLSRSPSDIPINLSTMRELLRSHQQDIVDRVVLQLTSNNQNPLSPTPQQTQQPPFPTRGTQPHPHNPTHSRIAILESQLAELRKQSEEDLANMREPRAPGTYYPSQPLFPHESESASTITASVEVLFPGVERSTLVQIIENRFKPTNIYRLLASEKERAETQRTISIGGIEFEQAERDGRESEYRISSFFKAWAAYSGILVKLAPSYLQGDLATALSIYTMNLYDLLEKYAWEGVKAYHLQFHRKRVASGKSIYHASAWRLLDSELVASKCFAHPAPRGPWPQSTKPTAGSLRRIHELPIRENLLVQAHQPVGSSLASAFSQSQHARGNTGSVPAIAPPCRNWSYRECRITPCRYQHACISCGSNHPAAQCPTGTGYQGPNRR